MRNDGIHMPELPEPTLDELERGLATVCWTGS